MEHNEFVGLQFAFAIVGAGIGFFVGMRVRDRLQIESAPTLFAITSAVLFFSVALYLLLILLGFAALAFCWLAWRYRSRWAPLFDGPLHRFARWRKPAQSVSDRLKSEMDHYDARTESILAQPYSPKDKTRYLEQLEIQHRDRIQTILDADHRSSDL